MSLCYIQLLGDFQLRYGDQVVTTINQPRLQSFEVDPNVKTTK